MIRLVSLIGLGAASFAAVYVATAPKEREAIATATIAVAAPGTAAAEEPPGPAADSGSHAANAAAPPPQGTAENHDVRNVTPDDMTAAPAVSGPLQRVPAPAKPAPPQQARMERLFNPLVISAGAIKTKDRTIRLAGVTVTDPEARCGEGVKAWPCGRVARTALRNFVHGRAIDCEIPAGANAIPDPAHCVVAGDDIGAWLVAQGWAKASGTAFGDAAKAAHDTKLGLSSDGRPDAQTGEVAARR